MRSSRDFYTPQLTRAVELLHTRGSVLISAAGGSGRSYFLRRLGPEFGTPAAPVIDASDRLAADALREHRNAALVSIDRLEHASPEVLEEFVGLVNAGTPCAAILEPNNQRSAFHQSLDALEHHPDDLVATVHGVAPLELPLLSPAEVARLLHEHSSEPLTAENTHAIVSLAEGRARWALALLALAHSENLASFPRPAIVHSPATGPAAAALRDISARVGQLSPTAVAAALVLSELEPLDLPGIRDLVGATHASELAAAGVLFPSGDHPLWYVPQMIATAISGRVSFSAVAPFEDEAQIRLLSRHAQGFPLTTSEALLCSRPLPRLPEDSRSAALGSVRNSVIQHTIASLEGFGHTELGSSLLLRTTDAPAVVSPVLRAATMGVLVSPEAGLSALGEEPSHEAGDDYLAWAGLRAILQHQAQQEVDRRAFPAQHLPDDDREDAALLARLWHSSEHIAPHAAGLSDIARRKPATGMGLFAGALLDLESAWHSDIVPQRWLTEGHRLPRTQLHTASSLPHVSGTILLAQALACFVHGESVARLDEISELAHRSPLREFHQRWIRHYREAALALACGDLDRSRREWKLLLGCAPSLAPHRLRQRLVGTLTALSQAAEPQQRAQHSVAREEAAVVDLFRYFAGSHAALAYAAGATPAYQHPLRELASAHLQAAAAEHPRELLRAAEQLRARSAWAPALAALAQAREVFLSRRAISNATECVEQLSDLERWLEEHIPWYCRGAPTSDFVRLTERERQTAALAARGLANRDIALQLQCSVRTVESHIAQARAKLGAASRRDLANFPGLFGAPEA